MADEVCDISGKEEMSVVVRYVDTENEVLKNIS